MHPLRRRHHGELYVGSPPLAITAIIGRSSDIKSALTALRIPQRNSPAAKQPGILVYGGEGGIRTLGTVSRTLA